MFDIGFWELILVGLVALLVFGPERLPRVARETALWIRKARNMLSTVKAEIDHELQLQELKQSLVEQKEKIDQEASRRFGSQEIESQLLGRQLESDADTKSSLQGHRAEDNT